MYGNRSNLFNNTISVEFRKKTRVTLQALKKKLLTKASKVPEGL